MFSWTATIVFVALFALITVMGFLAARWKAGDLTHLDEWGLGGRRFGTLVTWFLIGGDFYTAYTVIAVPALVYSVGAYGFFALPYTIIVYPFIFWCMPKLWSVCRKNNYVTAADFVSGRFSCRWLALAVALTGIVATMPYIALQLVGIQVVIASLGLGGAAGSGVFSLAGSALPLTIAFVILALYTYTSGLRAPAMIAFVKDIMIYAFVIAAIVLIPLKLGGYSAVFHAASKAFEAKGAGAWGLTLTSGQMVPFATLAFGSAMAAFMYPHTLTGILSSSSADVVKRNTIFLPAYTILLGLIALMGYMAISADIHPGSSTEVVPALLHKIFPEWFVGFSFAAIAIGALVPAAIMAIGAANLFTRNIWREFIAPEMDQQREAKIAKVASLVVMFGALIFILFLPTKYAIDLQLLGGLWMIQTIPAMILGLMLQRRISGYALLAGWAVGMGLGSWMAFQNGIKPIYTLAYGEFSVSMYIGVIALIVNFIVVIAGCLLASIVGNPNCEVESNSAAASNAA